MIAGAIVSDEFNKGTIKALLTLPYKRSTLLLAKYITTLIMVLLGIAFMILLEFIVGGIILGFGSLSIPFVTYSIAKGSLEVVEIFKYLLLNIIVNLPKLILLATLAFSISTILNSTAFSIAITFCGAIGSDIINSLAFNYKIKFLNYFVTTNWDFSYYLFGGKSVFGISLSQAVITCLVYLLIMLVVAFMVFRKKDIKNI